MWDVRNFEEEEVVRPEYEMACGTKNRAINPVTMEHEPRLPLKLHAPRYCLSAITVLFMVCLVLAALIAVIIYRSVMVTVFYALGEDMRNPYVKGWARVFANVSAALIQLVAIFSLNRVSWPRHSLQAWSTASCHLIALCVCVCVCVCVLQIYGIVALRLTTLGVYTAAQPVASVHALSEVFCVCRTSSHGDGQRRQFHFQNVLLPIRQLLRITFLYRLFQGRCEKLSGVVWPLLSLCLETILFQSVSWRQMALVRQSVWVCQLHGSSCLCFSFLTKKSRSRCSVYLQGSFAGRPGHYRRMFAGIRQEQCGSAGCLIELCIQMFVIFGGKQIYKQLRRAGTALAQEHAKTFTAEEHSFSQGV